MLLFVRICAGIPLAIGLWNTCNGDTYPARTDPRFTAVVFFLPLQLYWNLINIPERFPQGQAAKRGIIAMQVDCRTGFLPQSPDRVEFRLPGGKRPGPPACFSGSPRRSRGGRGTPPPAFPESPYPALDTGMGTDTDLTCRSLWGKGISIPCSLNALKTMK